MDSTSGQMARSIKDFGKMVFNMVKAISQILMVNPAWAFGKMETKSNGLRRMKI